MEHKDEIILDGTIGVMYDSDQLNFSYDPREKCKQKIIDDTFVPSNIIQDNNDDLSTYLG